MYYTSPGNVGVVSGMNEFGVTVTLNTINSPQKYDGKMPMAFYAREILQYSKNSYEARRMASTTNTSLYTTLLIGSALENEALLIEKSPTQYEFFKVRDTANVIVATSHFQADNFFNLNLNKVAKFRTESIDKLERLYELLKKTEFMTPKKAIGFLREKRGLQDSLLGYGRTVTYTDR